MSIAKTSSAMPEAIYLEGNLPDIPSGKKNCLENKKPMISWKNFCRQKKPNLNTATTRSIQTPVRPNGLLNIRKKKHVIATFTLIFLFSFLFFSFLFFSFLPAFSSTILTLVLTKVESRIQNSHINTYLMYSLAR